MNEFNPFTILGIDPNKDWEEGKVQNNITTSTPNQINPFKALGIDPNKTGEYQTIKTVNPIDQEVTSMLGITLNSMTDDEKQSYVDSLSEQDWLTWKKLKNEGYSFEARKALMDNSDYLYDIDAEGSSKYYQANQNKWINASTASLQSMLNFYQQNFAGLIDKYDEVSDEYINGNEEDTSLGKKVANVVNGLISAAGHFLKGESEYLMHKALGVYNTGIKSLNPTYETVKWDASNPSYQSQISAKREALTSGLQGMVGIQAPIAYLTLGTISQEDGLVADLINWVDSGARGSSDWITDRLFQIPLMQDLLNKPGNANLKEEISEGITYGMYGLLAALFKISGKGLGKTRAGIEYNKIKTRVDNALNESIKSGKEYGDRMKDYQTQEGNIQTNGELNTLGKENVASATKQGLREGRRRGWNKKNELAISETPTSNLGLPEKTTKTETVEVIPESNKKDTEIVKETKKLKLSEENKNNLANNPDLQTLYIEDVKPYIEENGKNNPEGLINEKIEDLVFDIRSSMDEFMAEQSNLNRNINQTKLTQFEKNLIKEIKEIIKEKDNKKVLKKLGKLTPQQQGLMDRIYPDLNKKITNINQLDNLMKEITKRDLFGEILNFQAKRPRTRLKGFIKKKVYKYISDYWDQKGIQYTIKDIDDFINGLSDKEINDLDGENFISLFHGKLVGGVNNKPLSVYKANLNQSDLLEVQRLQDKGYMPETMLYTKTEPGQLAEHQTIDELDTRPYGGGKTIREIFKEAGVTLTMPNKRIWQIRHAGGANIGGIYYNGIDLLAVPEISAEVGVLMHEFGHRLRRQLGDDTQTAIIQRIKDKTGLSDKGANERRAEYMRNFFLYGNIEGKESLEAIGKPRGTFWTEILDKDMGQKVYNTMEKIRNDLLGAFGQPNDSKIISTIENVLKLNEKGTEIVHKEIPQNVAELEKFVNDNISPITQYSESLISNGTDIVKTLKDQAITHDVKEIKINEDGVVVGKYHGHKGPVASIMENWEEINLDPELKKILEKQAEERKQKKFEESLSRLNN